MRCCFEKKAGGSREVLELNPKHASMCLCVCLCVLLYQKNAFQKQESEIQHMIWKPSLQSLHVFSLSYLQSYTQTAETDQ
jgi:hypothetical protein